MFIFWKGCNSQLVWCVIWLSEQVTLSCWERYREILKDALTVRKSLLKYTLAQIARCSICWTESGYTIDYRCAHLLSPSLFISIFFYTIDLHYFHWAIQKIQLLIQCFWIKIWNGKQCFFCVLHRCSIDRWGYCEVTTVNRSIPCFRSHSYRQTCEGTRSSDVWTGKQSGAQWSRYIYSTPYKPALAFWCHLKPRNTQQNMSSFAKTDN